MFSRLVMWDKLKKMDEKLPANMLLVVATVLAPIIAILVAASPSATTQTMTSSVEQYSTPARVKVLGSNIDVEIRQSKSNQPLPNTSISGSNKDTVLYLPYGQILELSLKGSNIDVKIDENIAEQVRTSELGSNIDVEVN